MTAKPSYAELERRVAELEAAERSRRRTERALRERIKELDCLYGISHLVESDRSLFEILQETARLVPDSWQYPDIATCRILLHGDAFIGRRVCDGSCDACRHPSMAQPVVVNGETAGEVRVCYTAERPAADEGPFLREERDLIAAVAERLGRTVERKMGREALARSQWMLARTERIARIGSWEWEVATDTVTWSEELFRIFGLPPGGRAPSWAEHGRLYHPRDMARLRSAVDVAVAEGRPYELELRAQRIDGEMRVCLARGFPEKGTGGEVVRLFGLIQDVTEQKRMEASLRESEERFRLLVENTLDAIWHMDLSLRFTYVNPAVEAILGYTPEEFVGTRLAEHCTPPNREKMEAVLAGELAGGVAREGAIIETELLDRDGRQVPVEVHARLLFDRHGNPAGLQGVTRDIRERRQAENERARLISAVDQAAEMFLITEVDGTIRYVNPAFEQNTGYPAGEAVGRTPRILKSGEQDEAFYRRLWETILAGGTWRGRMVDRRKDGTQFVSEAVISPVVDAAGNILNFVAVKRDITAEIDMDKKLAHAQRQEALGTLAGGIAHDFNNILFPIIGLAEMLLQDLDPEDPHHESVHDIFRAGKRGADLVRQILSFSRQAEEGSMPLRIQPILKEALKLCRSTLPSDIDIVPNIRNECGQVMADPTRIHRIVMNLITNAYQAMQGSGGTISVDLREIQIQEKDGLEPGRYARLSVADDGQGIAPEDLEKIFDPYFTTKEKGKGTGLGLSVVYGTVREYRGDIRVHSEVGRGSTFDVYLPLVDRPSRAEAVQTVEPDPTGEESILLVDDEEPILRLEVRMLERLGYRVTPRTSSIEALERFREGPEDFDLVITDMTMPNMMGDRLAGEILSIRPDTPVIVCTGFSERIDWQRAEAIGLRGLLMKPVLKSDLARMVREAIDEVKGTVCCPPTANDR